MINVLFFLLSIVQYFSFEKEKDFEVSFIPVFQEKSLELENPYCNTKGEGCINIEILRFYISDVKIWKEDVLVAKDEITHRLLDMDNPASFNWDIIIPKRSKPTHLTFTLGVDSLTNVSGAQGGDLDPTKGMYWTWKSGYVNFKLEGKADDCPGRKNKFIYHLGGYQGPNAGCREIQLPIEGKCKAEIQFSLDEFFGKVPPSKLYHIMSPNTVSSSVADIVASIFTIKE